MTIIPSHLPIFNVIFQAVQTRFMLL
uniref:Uncharacterized protein n=1 Tax=Tetranychus urticae TaxID=32264 RepID=T1L3M0_TETUR